MAKIPVMLVFWKAELWVDGSAYTKADSMVAVTAGHWAETMVDEKVGLWVVSTAAETAGTKVDEKAEGMVARMADYSADH